MFYVIFIVVFFLMGVLQFIGVSITLFSYILSILVAVGLLLVFLIKKKITIDSYMIANLCLLLWIVISGIANHTNPLLVINYLSFVVIPVSLYLLIRSINKDVISLKILINTLIIIQLPILLLQYFLPDYILYSQKSIALTDRMFGTFPLSSDHFLNFLLIMNIFYIGTKKSLLTFFDYFIIIYSIVCISLTNSVTSSLVLISTIAYIFFLRSNVYVKISSIIISVGVLVFLYFNIYKALSLLDKPELLEMTNTKYIAQGSAGRTQTFYYILTNKLSIFGNGPSSYFNPLKGGFQLNANFSQLLWFYYDLGVMGVVLLISLIYSFLISFSFPNHLRVYLFFLILAYSFSSTIFDQVAFLLLLNIFVSLFAKRHLHNSI